MKQNRKILLIVVALTSFIAGGVSGHYYPYIKKQLFPKMNIWDTTNTKDWTDGFSIVYIRSSVDDFEQPAYFFKTTYSDQSPLIVSLHTWSGDYSQNDPIAPMAKEAGWNYIHPDFRGPNWTVDACLSEKAITDIDDAIQYAIDNGNVDTTNVFVVGLSGGGYATLGVYLKTRHQIRAFLAWSPISDLQAWYYQSLNRNSKFAQDILKCTSDGNILDELEAKLRSPLFWDLPEKLPEHLEIYAGVNDGYTGAAPISNSILFYNRIAAHFGNQNDLVTPNEIIKLLTRGIDNNVNLGMLGDRRVLFKRSTKSLSLIIFDGTHEMLPEYCFYRMKTIAEHGV